MRKINPALLIFVLLFSAVSILSQVDMVPPSHRVYDYLQRMSINRIIPEFNYSMIPVSRNEIGRMLLSINSQKNKITATDKKLLEDLLVEFEYETRGTLKNSSSFFSELKFDILNNRKQKYLYAKADSNNSIFWDGIGSIRYMGANGDSIGKPHILLGQIGTRLRGTLFNKVGYYLRLSNGVRLGGDMSDAMIAAQFDPQLASTRKFVSEGSKTFDSYEGYLRFATEGDWLGITAGREALEMGNGFIDKMFISKNTAPFDFIKLDLDYKKVKYTFFHSSITGNDATGKQLDAKYLVFHRVELGPFINNSLNIGLSEMVIYSNVPLNFAFLNPISFLTSADMNTELPGKNSNNTLLGIDLRVNPVKKLALQGTLLIDDLNFETIGKDSTKGNDNKFGFQAGLNWQDAFFLPNLSFSYEWTHLDPFVYSHRDYNNSYTNWGQPIGHSLNPNSDEHAVKLEFNFGARLNVMLTYKHQRSGMNITDSTGNIITNVGSSILDGRGDFNIKNEFLKGLRVNRDIITGEITWQPIRQYYLFLKYQRRSFNYTEQNRTLTDNIFWGGFKIDY